MGTRHNRPERLWNSRKHSNRALAGNDYPHQWQQQRFHSFFLRISQRNVSRSLPPCFRADLLPVHQRKTVAIHSRMKAQEQQRVNACHNSYIQRSWKSVSATRSPKIISSRLCWIFMISVTATSTDRKSKEEAGRMKSLRISSHWYMKTVSHNGKWLSTPANCVSPPNTWQVSAKAWRRGCQKDYRRLCHPGDKSVASIHRTDDSGNSRPTWFSRSVVFRKVLQTARGDVAERVSE